MLYTIVLSTHQSLGVNRSCRCTTALKIGQLIAGIVSTWSSYWLFRLPAFVRYLWQWSLSILGPNLTCLFSTPFQDLTFTLPLQLKLSFRFSTSPILTTITSSPLDSLTSTLTPLCTQNPAAQLIILAYCFDHFISLFQKPSAGSLFCHQASCPGLQSPAQTLSILFTSFSPSSSPPNDATFDI